MGLSTNQLRNYLFEEYLRLAMFFPQKNKAFSRVWCFASEVSIQQADCEKDLAAAIPLVEQAEASTGASLVFFHGGLQPGFRPVETNGGLKCQKWWNIVA